MSAHRGKLNIDMINGPLLSNIIRYTIPIILTGILQLLFNAADLIVISHFRGSESVGAVGATGSLTNLFVNLFIGISTGVGVVVANAIGAKDDDNVRKTVHTAIPLAVICGVILSVAGVSFSEPLLRMMDTPEAILPKSSIYMKIYFCGVVFSLVYNFSAAILRATGDTKSPLMFLSLGGAANVILNVFFVTAFNMDIEGVAIATVVSQAISAILVIIRLMRTDGVWRFELKRIKIEFKSLKKILRLGLPTGIQGSVFALSNVIIQSSVNSFGASAVAGNAAGANIDGFIYVTMNAFYQMSLNFTGQNVGAGNIKRLGKIMRTGMLTMFVVAISMSGAVCLLSQKLLSIYITDDAAAIEFGTIRLLWLGLPYFLCGVMEILVGAVRGMGVSLAPMIISVLGVCGVRIMWIFTVFATPQFHTPQNLYLSYPASWIACILGHFICYLIVQKRLSKRLLKQ